MCTCLDNLVRDTICVHIHLCLRLLPSQPQDVVETDFPCETCPIADEQFDQQEDDLRDLATSAAVATKIISCHSAEKNTALIVKSQLLTAQLKSNQYTPEDETKIHSALDKLLTMTAAASSFKKNSTNKNSCRSVKRMSPQKRFEERKPKTRPSLSLSKLTIKKKREIISQIRAPLDSP
jgi:hypothetical protein